MGVEIDLSVFVFFMMSTPDVVSKKDKPGNHVPYLWPKARQKHDIFRIFGIAWGRSVKDL